MRLATWILRHQRATGPDHAARHGTLDIDSFPISLCGAQVGGAYNGYYKDTIYHPLVASFAAGGDYDSSRLGNGFVHAILRKGNAAAAQGAVRFILTAVEKARLLAQYLDVRVDAAFTVGPVMDPLTDAGVRFLGRLRNNAVLDRLAAPYLTRNPGRPPKEGYEHVIEMGSYQCDPWQHPQRLVLVIVDTLLLALLAFNLASMLRGEMEQATPQSGWDLSRLTESVLKAGGRVLEHGRRLFVCQRRRGNR
jgi:hypothetical protein